MTHSPDHAERAAIVAPCCEAEMGNYQGYVELVPPPHLARADGRGICVDACLALEITRLWALGITTTGCCCGHQKAPAFIGVTGADLMKMLKLGYVRVSGLGDPLALVPLTGCAAALRGRDRVAEEQKAEILRLRGLLIDPGDPAWEDARAVLVTELRKAEMPNHARAVADGAGAYIPSWMALNLIAHATRAALHDAKVMPEGEGGKP